MKHLLATLLLLTAMLVLTQTYNGTVSGSQTASAETGTVAFNLNATGDLPGMMSLAVRHDGGNITGGTWKITVLPANADATSTETGTLSGNFSGGALAVDTNGIAGGATSIQLTVQSGTGQFEAVTSGTGTLSLSADPENSSKLNGPLTFSF